MGSVAFDTTVTKDVQIAKQVDLAVTKEVDSAVDVVGTLATAEASADAIDLENVLAETDTFAQVSPEGAFSFSEALAAGSGDEPDLAEETLITNTAAGTAQNGQDVAISLTSHGDNLDATSPIFGQVTVGELEDPNFNIALIVDVSGSTFDPFSGDVTVGDLNNDGLENTILDAEIDALLAFLDELTNVGFDADTVDIGLISFNDAASVVQVFDDPADTALEDALTSLLSGGGTDFEPPLQEAISFFNAQPDASNVVFFLSDGFGGGDFADEVATLSEPTGINAQISAIGVGNGASQAQLDQIDNTGGSEIVTDPEQLRDAVITPTLSVTPVDFSVSIDGDELAGVDIDDLDQVLNIFSFDLGEVPGFNDGDTQSIEAEVTFDDGTTLIVENVVDNLLVG